MSDDRSAPNPNRPRLPDEVELALAPADRKSADGYAAVERAVDLINQHLDDGTVRVTIEFTPTVARLLTTAKDRLLEEDAPRPRPPFTLTDEDVTPPDGSRPSRPSRR